MVEEGVAVFIGGCLMGNSEERGLILKFFKLEVDSFGVGVEVEVDAVIGHNELVRNASADGSAGVDLADAEGNTVVITADTAELVGTAGQVGKDGVFQDVAGRLIVDVLGTFDDFGFLEEVANTLNDGVIGTIVDAGGGEARAVVDVFPRRAIGLTEQSELDGGIVAVMAGDDGFHKIHSFEIVLLARKAVLRVTKGLSYDSIVA